LSGVVLFFSIFFQKTVMGWHVSRPTQFLATVLVAYSLTRVIAGDETGILTWIAYYLGTFIIAGGIFILFGIFRRSG
jgi:hypothetical protein